MTIRDRAQKVIADHLGVGDEEILPDTSFQDDLNADSLDVVEMTMGLEEEFGIDIPDDDVRGVERVAQVYEYLERRLPAQLA